MNTVLTAHDVRRLCGATYYSRGQAYFRQGRVSGLTQDPDDLTIWIATVRGSRKYKVSVGIDGPDVESTCTCPAFTSSRHCKHVAAVLLSIVDSGPQLGERPMPKATPKADPAPKAATQTMTSDAARRLLDLFRQPQDVGGRAAVAVASPATHDSRTPLQVEFYCRPEGFYGSALMKLEMKVGPQRPYVIKDIKQFLHHIERHQRHFFSQKFTYDETQYAFREADRAVISILQDSLREESIYQTSIGGYSHYGSGRADRSMLVPPSAWQRLLPLLTATTTFIEHKGHIGPLTVVDDALPITARVLAHRKDTHTLQIEGLDEMTLLPNYHCGVVRTDLYPLDDLQLAHLENLRDLLESNEDRHRKVHDISLMTDDLVPFINEVVPGLRRIGHVHIDKKLSKLLIEQPLVTRVYLDYASAILRVRVTHAYGEVLIDPLLTAAQTAASAAATEGIVVRDLVAEQRVMHQLRQYPFTQAQHELHMWDEDDLYTFLFKGLPQLREIAQVYATTAVDALTTSPGVRPKSRVEMDSSTDWLDVSFDMGDLDEQDILEVLRSMVERKSYHRLRDGSFLSLEGDGFAQMGHLLEHLGVRAADLRPAHVKSGALRLPALRALPLVDEEPAQISGVKLGKSLRTWLDNLRNPDNLEFDLPAELSSTLRDYQKFGFQWLKTLSQYGFGGILADDMGLGKTLQAIAYLCSERSARQPDRPALIVCPASLTFNWLSEIEKFAPQLQAAVVTGDRVERFRILSADTDVDVLITSYPLLWRDVDTYTQMTFDALILDEAQNIKNHTTQTAKAVASIQSLRRFALTGTPVENSLDDLWSVFHAIFPGLFGSHPSFSQLNPEAVAKRIRPFVLRRLKRDVLQELPEKIETLQTAELSRDQKKVYLAYLAKMQSDTMQQLETEGFQKGRFQILAGLTRLRQICCHPSLFMENYDGGSGKLEQLLELVEEYMGANQRMLIFSQFTSMLHIIRQALDARKVSYFYLDGQTPAKERLPLCQRFNEGDAPVFLISLKAGGTGLNLTGADTVILYDLWWNPAVEEQAADRAHRIGQKRTVQVIRMVTQGTIEEKMYQLQENKRDLIDQVVESGASAGDAGIDGGLRALTEADIRELLAIGER